MSTNINISVGDNKLLEQARQQQAASRQAQLEKEANQRLEAQATNERTSALAAQGKDANGNPLYGVQSVAPSIDRRPAANRQDMLEVVRFYSRLDGSTRYLVSGDGSQEAAFALPPPLTVPTFPVLQNDTPYPTFPLITPTSSRIFAQQETRTGIAFDPLNPTIAVAYDDLTEAQDKRRLVRTKSFNVTRSFPLGDGRALVVQGRYLAYATIITRHSYSYTRFTDQRENAPVVLKDTLNSQTFTAELENNWVEQEDWIGVVVGKNSAQQVAVPQALKEAIIRQSQDNSPIQLGLQSRVCLPAANNLGQFAQGTNYDEGQFQCAGWPGTYGYEVYAIDLADRVSLFLTVPSPLSNERNPLVSSSTKSKYGFTLDGQEYFDNFSTSPSSWFNIDSREVDEKMQEASTHESLYSVLFSNGRSFGDLFKQGALVNLDSNGFKWVGPNLQGDVFTFPPSTDLNWKPGLKFAPTEPLEGNFQEHYVYDWGQKAFCREQAVRYGISPT